MANRIKKVEPTLFILSSQYYKPHIGGIENSLFYLAEAAIEQGHKAIIFVSNKGNDSHIKLPSFELEDNIKIVRYNFPEIPKILIIFHPLLLMASTYSGFRKLKKESHGEVIVISRTHFVVLGAIFAGFNKVAYLIPSTIKGLSDRKNLSFSFKEKIIEQFVLKLIIPQHHFIQKFAIRKAKLNLVFSNNMKHQVKKMLGKSDCNDPIIVSPGVDSKRFKYSEEQKKRLREEYNLANDFIFLCLGRITETKGYSDVIKAFSELPKEIQIKSKVLIVGDGHEIKHLKDLASDLKLNDNIILSGSSSKPEMFYSIADCFMMTSRYEAFGQTILEAMSSGLPIIAYKVDGKIIQTASYELIENGVNGFFCDFDIKSLSSQMNKIASLNQSEIIAIREQNIAKVVKEYQWSTIIKKVEELFKN